MPIQPDSQVIQWQDLKVRSELDIVLGIAQENGWEDCEVFGHGDMITQSQESNGWILIPADLYEYSIPARGINRVMQLVAAGVRIQGIIISDDKRRKVRSLPGWKDTLTQIKNVLVIIAKVLLGLILLAVFIALAGTILKYFVISAIAIPLFILGMAISYDPKLIILVDAGNGSTVWVSIFTWYE